MSGLIRRKGNLCMQVTILNTPTFPPNAREEDNATRQNIFHNIVEIVQNLDLESQEITVTFASLGTASLVALLQDENDEKYALKFPINSTYPFREVPFLRAWEDAGIYTPRVITYGKILKFPYVLMEYIDAPTYWHVFLQTPHEFDISIYKSIGDQLAQIHTVETSGYGRLLTDGPEYATHGDWIEKNPYIKNQFAYITENNINDQYNFQLPNQDKINNRIFSHIHREETTSYWCHMDCSLGNIFATPHGSMLFDPGGLLSHPYYDLAHSMVLACIYHDDPIVPAELLFEGYAAMSDVFNNLQKETLIPFIQFQAVMKIRQWHAGGKTERLERLEKILDFSNRF